MGFMKIITSEGVQDIEDMTMEDLLGLQVALMAEGDKQPTVGGSCHTVSNERKTNGKIRTHGHGA